MGRGQGAATPRGWPGPRFGGYSRDPRHRCHHGPALSTATRHLLCPPPAPCLKACVPLLGPPSCPSPWLSALGGQRGHRGQGGQEAGVDVDAPQEDLLVKELVVVVEQHRGAVHGREANSGVSCLRNGGGTG